MKRQLKKVLLLGLLISIQLPTHAFMTRILDGISNAWKKDKVSLLAIATCIGCAGYFAWNYFCSRQWRDHENFYLEQESFDIWHARCKKLTPNIQQANSFSYPTALKWHEFQRVLDDFYAAMKTEKASIVNKKLWVSHDDITMLDQLFAAREPITLPFVQKLNIPANSVVSFHGDLHGDIHSLLAYVKTLQKKGYMDSTDAFKIAKNNFYMVFLGDYVDRGRYGVEVLYTIMRLKIANPDRVFMVRGNHEDAEVCNQYGFRSEFNNKFGNHTMAYNYTCHIYDFLPVALYLGTGNDYIQCCHGGIEMGFDPSKLLSHPSSIAFTWLDSRQELCKKACSTFNDIFFTCAEAREISRNHAENMAFAVQNLESFYSIPGNELYNGFMWNDFDVPSKPSIYLQMGIRGLLYGSRVTLNVLQNQSRGTNKIRGVFRAHQHGDPVMMQSIVDKNSGHTGLSKLWKGNHTRNKNLWDGIVCTFCVAPDSVYSQAGKAFDYDAFGLLTTAKNFENWNLEVIRNPLSTILPS